VPAEVHAAADARLRVPIKARSLNIVMAAAMAIGEALRQTAGFDTFEAHSAASGGCKTHIGGHATTCAEG
jgi:hypothetical protein